MKGEAIVVFKKGVTFDEAEKVLAASDMKIVKQYRALSEQNGELYLLVKSSRSSEEMVRILRSEKRVKSVSSNQRRGLNEQ